MSLRWELDEWGAWNLHTSMAHAWIIKRPSYCDRGHYSVNVDGIPDLDSADRFPRYYMSLDVAKSETEKWLRWRAECEQRKTG